MRSYGSRIPRPAPSRYKNPVKPDRITDRLRRFFIISPPSVITQEFLVALGAAFIASWPTILTNLISEILANFLQIQTDDGVELVIALTIATLLMFGLFRRLRGRSRQFPLDSSGLGNSKMQMLLQGSLFSLAIALNLTCSGFLTEPISLERAVMLAASLLPALEGTIGRRILAHESISLHSEVMAYIDDLISHNARASQRAVEAYISEHWSGTLIPTEILSGMVRAMMTEYLGQYRERWQGLIVLDGYSEPANLKLRFKPTSAS